MKHGKLFCSFSWKQNVKPDYVGEITKQTHLSRPAVSHHLRILREAGIILMRKEGTKTFIILIYVQN